MLQSNNVLFRFCHRRVSISSPHHHHYRRSMAIYAVGEGWTGAMRRENILKKIPGHFDEEVSEEGWKTSATTARSDSDTTTSSDISTNNDNESSNLFSSLSSSSSSSSPVLIYQHDDLQQATVGWGNSAILDTQGVLRIVGRSHDLVSLLRLNRMPGFLQRWVNRNHDTSATTPIGGMISTLIGFANGSVNNSPEQNETWKIAEKYSLLDDWTKISINNNSNNKNSVADNRIKQVACGPGFLAVIGEAGTL
jgi:hypothetical protein